MDNYAQTTPIVSLTQEQLREISSGIFQSDNIKVGLNTNADSIPFESSTPQFQPLKQGAVIDDCEYTELKKELETAKLVFRDALQELTVKTKSYLELKKCQAVVDCDDETRVLRTHAQLKDEVHMEVAILQKTLECFGVEISDVFKKEGL
tara:strand:+ start:1494 stop:1943 length:450 start_codon:yes stop_codon:yes gene_type:complete